MGLEITSFGPGNFIAGAPPLMPATWVGASAATMPAAPLDAVVRQACPAKPQSASLPVFRVPGVFSHRLLARRVDVPIIEGDDDGDDIDRSNYKPEPLPKYQPGEPVPLHRHIDDREPPPGWERRRPRDEQDNPPGDWRQGYYTEINPDDDVVDYTVKIKK